MFRAQTSSKVSTYSYNALGMRNAKTVDSKTSYQIWSNGNVISEYGAHTAVYRYGSGLVDTTAGGIQRYYLYNGHGDTTQLVDSQGSVIADYQYDAFGNPMGGENADIYNPFGCNGQYTDEESGLLYLRNRYYDPATGRFMTEDPYWNPDNMIYCDDPGNTVLSKQSEWTQIFDDGKPPVRFSQDCTNFVSWCLRAGGVHMSDDWYYNVTIGGGDYVIGSYSATWINSEEQFKAFTNCTGEFPNFDYINGNAICIHESQWIANFKTMGHTAIIVSVDNGRIICIT